MVRKNAGFLGLPGGRMVDCLLLFYLTLEDIIAVKQQCVEANKRLAVLLNVHSV